MAAGLTIPDKGLSLENVERSLIAQALGRPAATRRWRRNSWESATTPCDIRSRSTGWSRPHPPDPVNPGVALVAEGPLVGGVSRSVPVVERFPRLRARPPWEIREARWCRRLREVTIEDQESGPRVPTQGVIPPEACARWQERHVTFELASGPRMRPRNAPPP